MSKDELFVVNTPLKYSVSCSQNTWESHIAESHAIMQPNLDAVKDALTNPSAVYESKEWDNRDVYFGLSNSATYGEKLYTTVIVDQPDEYNKEGQLVTAYPRKDIGGNINEGKLKYVQIKSR